MEKVMIATKNNGKVKEFKEMLGSGLTVQSLLDLPFQDIEETGQTFAENAILKAQAVHDAWNCTAIADDSGLEIDALHGKPGIYSARYAGPAKNDQANIEKVLWELEGVPIEKRTARFVCVIAVAVRDHTHLFKGTCEGRIALYPSGDNGFGYDPIFYIPSQKATMAELPSDQKNRLSHRYHALEQLTQKWDSIFQ
ncbi:XTP/dITP diphosphatase [Bacillus piscicola]|uniref:XTP/dITP diphosphatase n=1 Tax=Bacillus piscicola TaxID=1632684 RepID=UPI001F0953BE|nr:XTP/dITP diphosphatase [Bacillus piscicola]